MPRGARRKELPTGLPYGQGQRLEESEAAVADAAAAGPGPAGTGTSGGGALVPAAPRPGQIPPEVLAAAAAGPVPGDPLSAPSTVPGEPITAGMPFGPGPGPEAIHQRPAGLAEFYENLADLTGDAFYMSLARRARMRG